ncbi:MAG TPA: GNAT family N-acetyltransferase [Kofleriaceae bacterium]|nr:GNAT family N-acetyltransferase [Kofleriaceae bacterium]
MTAGGPPRAPALDLPDQPRYVEAHGIAADPASWRRELGTGFAVGSDRARLIVVCNEADPGATLRLARERPLYTFLLMTDDLAAALRGAGRGVVRAILHTLPDPAALPDLDGAAALAPDTSLAHTPEALAEELHAAHAYSTVWAAWVDGAPVSFAYAPWRSPRWFDVSVDTLAATRQLGLGTLVAAAMIRDERARGREPVWGADEHNLPSLRLARRLGFRAVDELWLAAPPSG